MRSDAVAVMPLHDPEGRVLPRLPEVLPLLKRCFSRAIVTLTWETSERCGGSLGWLEDPFFDVLRHIRPLPVGEDFLALYRHAVDSASPGVLLHLCFPDRVLFALSTPHRETFAADLHAITTEDVPLIFVRSEGAWETHPRNYRDLEGMVTRAGELLLGRTLDFAWCHLVLRAEQLRGVLPRVRRRDISMVAEIVLGISGIARTRSVDWLAWEDPYLAGRDPNVLKAEREVSVAETRKRLRYVVPMLQLLYEATEEPYPTDGLHLTEGRTV